MIQGELDLIYGKEIKFIHGLRKGSTTISIFFKDAILQIYHNQSCCEEVHLEDLEISSNTVLKPGDKIYELTETSNKETTSDEYGTGTECEWTFYRIRTEKGYAVLRWLGEIDDTYSTEVTVECYSIDKTLYEYLKDNSEQFDIYEWDYEPYLSFIIDDEKYCYMDVNDEEEPKTRNMEEVRNKYINWGGENKPNNI